MGATRTELPDGRVVCVGGEHEDFYDPDFCIYNDVVVLGPTDEIEIYGYPRDVFPPTDFHTATLVGHRIILVGCLGYSEDRRPGHTPVYALDLSDYHISEVPTTGHAPGWVFKHEALPWPDGIISVQCGEVIEERDGKQRTRRNFEAYALDTRAGSWRRLTNRNWAEFRIHRQDHRMFPYNPEIASQQLLPRGLEHTALPSDEPRETRIEVRGVPVSIAVDISHIDVVVEGELPDDLARHLVEEIRSNAEAVVHGPCVLE
jgi:hypothetical protein